MEILLAPTYPLHDSYTLYWHIILWLGTLFVFCCSKSLLKQLSQHVTFEQIFIIVLADKSFCSVCFCLLCLTFGNCWNTFPFERNQGNQPLLGFSNLPLSSEVYSFLVCLFNRFMEVKRRTSIRGLSSSY